MQNSKISGHYVYIFVTRHVINVVKYIFSFTGFQYVKECLISVLALILVIAVTAFWFERQKRYYYAKTKTKSDF